MANIKVRYRATGGDLHSAIGLVGEYQFTAKRLDVENVQGGDTIERMVRLYTNAPKTVKAELQKYVNENGIEGRFPYGGGVTVLK